jgi:transcriptional regulator with XRE-family HTH domain
MPIRLQDFIANLPKDRQQAIAKRTAELMAEVTALSQIREARDRSQQEIATKLNINQAAVSKLERRTDMYLSTLRRYIEAMGGELEIIARFPQHSVRITQFSKLDPGLLPEESTEPTTETPAV